MIEILLGERTALDTGFPCDVLEVQPKTQKPYYLIEMLASPPWESTMAETAVMGDINYQISVVGVSPAHFLQAEGRLISSLKTSWKHIPGCTGPPDIRRNGGSRQDDRTYRGMVIATYKVNIP